MDENTANCGQVQSQSSTLTVDFEVNYKFYHYNVVYEVTMTGRGYLGCKNLHVINALHASVVPSLVL